MTFPESYSDAAPVVQRYLDVAGLGNPRRFGYAHAVRAGHLLFLAGHLGINSDYQPVSDNFDDQARAAFDNLRHTLSAAGVGVDALVSMTIYLTDMRNSARLFEIREEKLGSVFAASAAVGVTQLALPELQVEVQAVAFVVPPSS